MKLPWISPGDNKPKDSRILPFSWKKSNRKHRKSWIVSAMPFLDDMMRNPVVHSGLFLSLVALLCLLWKRKRMAKTTKCSKSAYNLLLLPPVPDSKPRTPKALEEKEIKMYQPDQSANASNTKDAPAMQDMIAITAGDHGRRMMDRRSSESKVLYMSKPGKTRRASLSDRLSFSEDQLSNFDIRRMHRRRSEGSIILDDKSTSNRLARFESFGSNNSATDDESSPGNVIEGSMVLDSMYEGISVGGSTVGGSFSSSSSYVPRRRHSHGSIGSLGDSSTFSGASSKGPSHVTIYFASQSGTSAYYAAQMQREGKEMGFDIGLCSIRSLGTHLKESTSPEQELRQIFVPHTTRKGTPRRRAVFLVSTFHDGGPTDDAVQFLGIVKTMQTDCLKGFRFAVIGFGDSKFGVTYNLQAKMYDTLFEELGGKRMLPVMLLDQARDVELDLETYKWLTFWPKLSDLAAKDFSVSHSKSGGGSVTTSTGEPSEERREKESTLKKERSRKKSLIEDPEGDFDLEILTDSSLPLVTGPFGQIQSDARHFVRGVDCHIKSVEPLWHDINLDPSWEQPGSVMCVEFDLTPSQDGIEPFRYETGDNIAILPINKLELVEAVSQHLDYTLDTTFILTPKKQNNATKFEYPFPTPCTVREYLSHYCELSIPPRRAILRALSKFATLAHERDELYRLSSVHSYTEFNNRVVNQKIGMGALLCDYFPSIRIPLTNFIRLCVPLQPRWYSVACSPLVNQNALAIAFSVVTIPRTIDNSVFMGACSHYLANLMPSNDICCRIIRMGSSGFVAPPIPQTPLIMVCNGTGISPMRALLQELHYKKNVLKEEIGPVSLFFGIRRRNLDFLFEDELECYLANGTLSELQLACSREQVEKIYVQHLVATHSDRLWALLQGGAHMYICGASNMTSDVDAVIRSAATRSIGPVEASEFFDEMEREHRYIREGWFNKLES